MVTRRDFVKYVAVSGATVLVPWRAAASVPPPQGGTPPFRRVRGPRTAQGALPGGTLDPTTIVKYDADLVIPPPMPQAPVLPPGLPAGVDYYEIAVRQFQQQILPAALPATTVWSYGSAFSQATFNYPAFTIEATNNRPVRVKWINELVSPTGHYLPHLLPVDPTLHWANPPGGPTGRDTRPTFTTTPGRYTGPVPIVTHVHGAHTHQESDGYAEAWFLPQAVDMPAGFATTGTFYDKFKASSPLGADWTPNSAVFEYPNDQRATTLWYHDHTLGMTRVNVYAGPAGFYLLRGGASDLAPGVLPGPAPAPNDPPGTKYFEIPIAIQDRSFNSDGSLFFPDSRAFFDGTTGPYVPDSEIAPIWNPESFGNTVVVNGKTWPRLNVEARRYRFRLLNGCNARFVILQISANPVDPTGQVIPPAVVPFYQIGAEGGFLPAPVTADRLLIAPAGARRCDRRLHRDHAGNGVLLINLGPDEPFGGGVPVTGIVPGIGEFLVRSIDDRSGDEVHRDGDHRSRHEHPGGRPAATIADNSGQRRHDPPRLAQRVGSPGRVQHGAHSRRPGDCRRRTDRPGGGAAHVARAHHRRPRRGVDGDMGDPQLHF